MCQFVNMVNALEVVAGGGDEELTGKVYTLDEVIHWG